MYPDWVWLAVFIGSVTVIWLGILTFLIWQQRKFLKLFFSKSGEKIRRDIDLAQLEERVSQIQREGLKHIKKVHLSRYNPYDETGGDQSFSVAFLDSEGTGIVVTSLHARSATRVFAKPVIKGEGSKYRFSKEEEFVIKKALNE